MTTINGQNDLSKTQNLTMVVAYDYKGLRVVTNHGRAPPNGLKDDTRPNGPKTVTLHRDRF